MPDKPLWYNRLDTAIAALERLEFPWIDRATLEPLLGVGRRRAQQILAPLVTRQVGRNGLADRQAVIAHLRALASGETAGYERRRREQLARQLERLRRDWIERPRVLVEAPRSVLRQKLAGLPTGISISPGEIRVCFSEPQEALEKLLALAMAIGNDRDGFEKMAAAPGATG